MDMIKIQTCTKTHYLALKLLMTLMLFLKNLLEKEFYGLWFRAENLQIKQL